jgi:hypothetical protein
MQFSIHGGDHTKVEDKMTMQPYVRDWDFMPYYHAYIRYNYCITGHQETARLEEVEKFKDTVSEDKFIMVATTKIPELIMYEKAILANDKKVNSSKILTDLKDLLSKETEGQQIVGQSFMLTFMSSCIQWMFETI